MHTTFIYALIPFILIAVCILVQVKLSNVRSLWPGLLIPAICIIFSIITVTNTDMYTQQSVETTVINNKDEQIIDKENTISTIGYETDTTSKVFTTIYLLIVYNIPTFIFACIYVYYRGKIRKQLVANR